MTNVIERSEWGARSPRYTNALDWNEVIYFVIHYSGGPRDQTVRAIQDWCMDGKGHSDIDYNELIRGNDLYVGRGDNKGGHTLNLNSKSYGVCVIGVDGDATPDDLRVLQERYRYACDRAGRMLTVVGHKEAPGQDPTSCPGSELLGWIHAGLIEAPADPPGDNWTEVLVENLPTARLGHHDAKTVKTIQGLMNRDAGNDGAENLVEDGVWGPRTDNRVRGWQALHDVPNSVRSDGSGDGIFGRQSWTFALTLA